MVVRPCGAFKFCKLVTTKSVKINILEVPETANIPLLFETLILFNDWISVSAFADKATRSDFTFALVE